MDNAQLKAFVAVADSQSFSRAADQLHLTQPAVSKRIGNLEAELGQRLFDRVGHAVHLTPAGQTLLPRARRLLQDMDDASTALSNLTGRIAGPLRIATSHHIGLRRLPALLREYTVRYPAVTLEFDFVDSEQAYHEVEQGLRELAIVTLPDEPQASVTAVPVWRERLIPCVQRDHPLARGKEVAIADLAAHRAVLLGGHTFTQQKVDQLFAAHRVELQDRTSSSYLEAIAMLVTAGQGWALLPDIMVRDELVALPVQPPIAIERSLGVVHHRDRTLSNAGRALVQLLRAAADRSV
ncbi:MAG TPA: LysR family transcriptional regulator [Permianibacter sp.]|nr:LysR family transcriptional regulator [Permianibacter sp.]